MSDLFDQLKLDDSTTVKEQVGAFLRGLIESGKLAPGARLPSLRHLARSWNLPVSTAQTALKPLLDERLLHTTPGLAMRVCHPRRDLTCVGIYDPGGVELHAEMAFGRAVLNALRDRLAQTGSAMRLFVDLRAPRSAKGHPLPDLAKACAQGAVQGVILVGAGPEILPWAKKLPVPVTCMANGQDPHFINADFGQFMTAGVNELARQGCRSVGFIVTYPRPKSSQHADYLERFSRAASAQNLKTSESWMHFGKEGQLASYSREQFGYEKFTRLWREKNKPDGLIVFDDVAARGVTMAMLEHGVQTPDKLKVVFHRNVECPFYCPIPASFLEFSAVELAEAALRHLRRQFYEHTADQIVLSFKLNRFKPKGRTP